METNSIKRFKLLTVQEFQAYINQTKSKITRPINHIQVHCTWRPTLKGYLASKDKERVIRSMWTTHTTLNGWKDIGQNLTFSPDGVWLCRDLNTVPAGIANHNSGGIAVEMIGDFDISKEWFSPDYYDLCTTCFAILKEAWPDAEVIFHRDYSDNRTCPGTAITKDKFIPDIEVARKKIKKTIKPNYTPLQAIDSLQKGLIIASPDYWKNSVNLRKSVTGTNILILIRKYYQSKYSKLVTDDKVAIRQLGIEGVFTSMDFWNKMKPDTKIAPEIVDLVLVRMAEKF